MYLLTRFKAPRPTLALGAIALGLAGALAGTAAGTAFAAVAAQPGEDVTAWPLVAAILSLLAIPVVASTITALLRKAGDAGLKPQTIVWLVTAAIVLVAYLAAGGVLPAFDPADPAATAAGWLALIVALERFAGVLYDTLLKRLLPAPAPTPETPPA